VRLVFIRVARAAFLVVKNIFQLGNHPRVELEKGADIPFN